jgi:hypothetical protein
MALVMGYANGRQKLAEHFSWLTTANWKKLAKTPEDSPHLDLISQWCKLVETDYNLAVEGESRTTLVGNSNLFLLGMISLGSRRALLLTS